VWRSAAPCKTNLPASLRIKNSRTRPVRKALLPRGGRGPCLSTFVSLADWGGNGRWAKNIVSRAETLLAARRPDEVPSTVSLRMLFGRVLFWPRRGHSATERTRPFPFGCRARPAARARRNLSFHDLHGPPEQVPSQGPQPPTPRRIDAPPDRRPSACDRNPGIVGKGRLKPDASRRRPPRP